MDPPNKSQEIGTMMNIRDFANTNYKQYAIYEAKHGDAKRISYDKISNDMLFNGFDFNDEKPVVRYRLYEKDYIVEINEDDWDLISSYF